jgi:hypothetical protein
VEGGGWRVEGGVGRMERRGGKKNIGESFELPN